MRHLIRSGCAVAALSAAFFASPGVGHADEPLLSMRAVTVNMNGGRMGQLDIVVERWSTPEEVSRLRSILVEKGSDKLIDALRDMKPRAGYIRTPESLGWDVGFARETKLHDGARRIVLATDRPMSFNETRNQPRSAEYEFMLIEIRLDAKGKGQGKLVNAGKVEYDRETNTLEIENYNIEPTRLTQVEVRPAKKK